MLACTGSEWSLTAPVVLTLGVAAAVFLLAHWLRRQTFPGAVSFILLHAAILWWLATTALELLFLAPDCKVFWASMAWPGIIAVPTLWAVFLWQYVNSLHLAPRPSSVATLCAMPLLTWIAALTNPWHGLFYGEATSPISADPGAAIHYAHGPLFFSAAAYGYAFMLFCVGITVRAAWLSKRLYRMHYLAFVALSTIPWAANVGYVVFEWTVFGVDPTPFSFALTVAAFAWLIAGLRLFDMLPVARHLLLEALLDPVIVVDPRYRVIEANPSAIKLAGLTYQWHGEELASWPRLGPELQELLTWRIQTESEQVLMLQDPEQYFEVGVREITRHTHKEPIRLGQMIYLRDITRRHLSELKLSEALAVSEERLETISSLHELLKAQALRDPLTGLYNRRYLDDLFARELARAERNQTSIAVALIDLDHFKRLNDTHGHLAGDDALKAVAAFLLNNVREADAVFRIGGEEFLVILPGASAEEALEKMRGICAALAATPVPTRNGHLSITLSGGLAHFPAQAKDLDGLMVKADAELYRAKNAGRNQVLGTSD